MVNNMAKANLLLKNDVGLVLDITESPLACTVYDLEGNEISGGGSGLEFATMTVAGYTGFDTFSFSGAWLETEDEVPYVTGGADEAMGNGTYKVILYNGFGTIFTNDSSSAFVLSGNASSPDEGVIEFTGDFTVTKA